MDSIARRASATPVDLATFLQLHGSSLPRTVKLVDGFCGTNDGDTLEADQILVFYKVERQKMIITLDQFNQELCVPRNSTNKVQLLPFEYHNEHSTVQELFGTDPDQTPYFRVLEGIPSLQISSETTLKRLSNQTIHNFLKCEVVDIYDAREVLLPLQLTGRFQPLLDAREYYLEEVLAQYELPMNIRFVPQSRANDGTSACPLSSLGNLHLIRETEVEMVFAASLDDQLLLNLFPRTLDINVSCGFKITAESSKKIKECRETLKTSEKTLRRLDRIATNSFYFTACPIRRFNFESLQPPSISSPKKDRVVQADLMTKAAPEDSSINREAVTKRARAHLSSKTSRSLEDVQAAYQENCEIDEIFNNSWSPDVFPRVSKVTEEDTDSVPALPPKLRNVRSSSTTANDATQASTQSPCRPVPKPRKRLREASAEHQENMKPCVSPLTTPTQSQSGNVLELSDKSESVPQSSACTEDDVDETCPELPPRPEFLKQSLIENKEENYVSREKIPPPLPPRDYDGDCQAYLVVDVTDWRAVEERAQYTEVKDDGRVFKQDDLGNLVLSRICPPDEREEYINMERQRPEVNGEQRDQQTSHQYHYIDPDESRGHEDPESTRLGEADYIDPDESRGHENRESPRLGEAEREGEAARHFEREISEADTPYEEIEEREETPRREHQRKENENGVKLKKTKVENSPSRSKHTQRSVDTSPRQSSHHPAVAIRKTNMMISSRQEEDFMDFKEIEEFLKLSKKLSEANVKLADLEKQVTESAATQQPPASTASTSAHVENSKLEGKDSWDENQNCLNSSGTLCKHPQTSSQVGTKSESVLLKREADVCETKMEEKNPSLFTLAPENIGLEKARHDQERDEINKADVSDSDEDDYEHYVECYDRQYVNQHTEINCSFEKLCDDKESAEYVNVEKQAQTGIDSEDADDGINSIYYNTVEIATKKAERTSYLQLENPNDEEENVYVNVDAQKSEKSDHDGDLINDIAEPPPLPPKKQSSSLRDAQ